MNKTYGYARVSSNDQNLARQLDAFQKLGIAKNNIFCDKQSGKNFERKNYQKLIKKLKKDDVLIIKSIDRLGRDYNGIIKEWNLITNIKKCKIFVIDMPLLDTRTNSTTLVGKFISDLVLQILSFVAQNERENIKQRQQEGIISAKNRGVKFGRPEKNYIYQYKQIFTDYETKKISLKSALTLTNLKENSFYYHLRKFRKCFDILN